MTLPAILLTLRSGNHKAGPIPVSTSAATTCPDACPLKRNGCYAESGPLGMLWSALNKAKPGKAFQRGPVTMHALTWPQFCAKIAALPTGTLWRHNQAGDLPGPNNRINAKALAQLVEANRGKRGFTYTHKPLTSSNLAAIASANAQGFTINLSADTLGEADQHAETGLPVVALLPATVHGNAQLHTPAGRRVVVCPATYRDGVSCATCQLCQRASRSCIVGFPAHGAGKRKASAIAST